MTKHDPSIPCYGCTERNEICHTKAYGCERWAKYQEVHQADLRAREAKFERDLDYMSYKGDRIAKKKRRKNRPA
ncbi:MAG: hypothetical protein J6S14_14825 [Clostridia bacterium]|nr:hypothetical protein [Clostridia bacterium]